MIRLSDAHLDAIRAHGVDTFPHECCGAILGDVAAGVKIVRELRPLPNVFSPDQMFALMQEERRTKRKILGFYHSHPNHPAHPSEYDRVWASPWYTYIIVSIRNRQPADLTAWQLDDAGAAFQPEEIEIVF